MIFDKEIAASSESNDRSRAYADFEYMNSQSRLTDYEYEEYD